MKIKEKVKRKVFIWESRLILVRKLLPSYRINGFVITRVNQVNIWKFINNKRIPAWTWDEWFVMSKIKIPFYTLKTTFPPTFCRKFYEISADILLFWKKHESITKILIAVTHKFRKVCRGIHECTYLFIIHMEDFPEICNSIQCSSNTFVKGINNFQNIMLSKILETNFSFHLKFQNMAKFELLFFSSFLLVSTTFFIFGGGLDTRP